MSNTISSWFIPFWYSAASGESTTLELINKRREELKTQKKEPSFPKTLTPAKATAGGVGILGIFLAVFGFFKDNSWGKLLGIGAAVLAGVGWFVDKLFVKESYEKIVEEQVKETKTHNEELINELTPLIKAENLSDEEKKELIDKAPVEILPNLIEHGSPVIKIYIIGKLSKNSHSYSLDCLIKIMKEDTDENVRIEAIKAFSHMFGWFNINLLPESERKSILDTLKEVAEKDTSDKVKSEANSTLSQIKEHSILMKIRTGHINELSIEELKTSFLVGDTPTCRPTAEALVSKKEEDPKLVDFFINHLTEGSFLNPHIYSAWALGEIKDPKAIAPLVNCLRGCNHRTAEQIIDALVKIGDNGAIEQLKPLLTDKSYSTRTSAICALGKLGGSQVVSNLTPLLDDDFATVCIQAAKSLGEIGDPSALNSIEVILNRESNNDTRKYDFSDSINVHRALSESKEKILLKQNKQ